MNDPALSQELFVLRYGEGRDAVSIIRAICTDRVCCQIWTNSDLFFRTDEDPLFTAWLSGVLSVARPGQPILIHTITPKGVDCSLYYAPTGAESENKHTS